MLLGIIENTWLIMLCCVITAFLDQTTDEEEGIIVTMTNKEEIGRAFTLHKGYFKIILASTTLAPFPSSSTRRGLMSNSFISSKSVTS
jgi:hypothetical protein